ncbi:uncharacterized protein PAC_00171 [Phialocephala subalpina]|uniref:Zn(2)-C6 fungal-type domain-containing protein n=1 Tax=Phialocephala subalpina TaxID=576137 RepID=A0A1L7WCA4_9HELO|nr:uncharacterized protein PAC_00171 [Phialocephala subalpina]
MPQSTSDAEAALSSDSLACAQLLRQLLTQLRATAGNKATTGNKRSWMSMNEGNESLSDDRPSSQQQAPGRDVQPQMVAITSTADAISRGPKKKTPRTRASLACHECRYRKVRCDGSKPVCGTCQARGRRYTCSYVRSAETEKKRDIFGYIDRLEENLLQSRQSQQDNEVSDMPEKDSGALLANKLNAAIYNGSHEDSHNNNQNDNHIDTDRDGPHDIRDGADAVDPISHDGRSRHPAAYIEELSALERAQVRHHRSFGSSSTINFMAQVQNLPAVADLSMSCQDENQSPSSISGYFNANLEEQRTKNPSMLTQCIGAGPTVSPSLMKQLLDVYFTRVHCIHPYLHRPTWQGKQRAEALINGVADPDTGDDSLCACMVNLVFALGALYCDNLPVDNALHISEKFFLKAKRAITIEQLETPSLELAQNLLLMTQYSMERCLHQRGHLHASLTYISLAIRVCQSLGLHQNSTKMISHVVREVTKRVWWGCVYFDLSLSIHFGQPSSISSHQYDTDLPLAVDDEIIFRDKILTQEPGTFPKTAFFVYGIQLAQVLESINREIYDAVGNRPSQFSVAIEKGDFTILKKLESALLDWRGSLPEELRVRNNGYDSLEDRNWISVDRQAITLYLRYQYALVLLYRPFLSYLLESLCQGQSTSMNSPMQRSFGSFWHTIMVHHADACVNVAVETINFVHACTNFEGASPSMFKGSTWGLTYIYSMISVLIAAKCCHLQDDLSPAVFYKAWDQVIDILRAYRASTQPTEIPFRFLESIDRRLFRATRDKTPPQTQTQLPSPVETAMSNGREAPGVVEPWDPLPSDWMTQTLSPSWDELGLHWLDSSQTFDRNGDL